jgi:hypothetical protein
MLQFNYTPTPLRGSPPASASQSVNFKPLAPIKVANPHSSPTQTFSFREALVDSGSDDTIFPLAVIRQLQLTPIPGSRGHRLNWRGVAHALQFAEVLLKLESHGNAPQWRTVVGFTDAALKYPLLGQRGCFEFLNFDFHYGDNQFEIRPGAKFTYVKAP